MRPITARGFRDIMPEEALEREKITRIVSDGFGAHGYLPIETPLLEEDSSLEFLKGTGASSFSLFDNDGDLLQVRSDLTIPIARLVATRLGEVETPIRLRYAAPVVREQARNMGRSRQYTQLGVELIGAGGIEADAEILSMAAEALTSAGVKGWKIVCGSVQPMNDLLEASGLGETEKAEILAYVHASNFVDLDDKVASLKVGSKLREALSRLPRVCGGLESLDEAESLLDTAGVTTKGIAKLRVLMKSEEIASFADNILIDFSVMNSFGYYTGLVFAVYANGVSSPLGSGGRYDDVFSKLGDRDLPSAGFALSLEQIEEAIQCDTDARPLRIAVPKGSLFEPTVEILKAAGFDTAPLENPGRQLIVHGDGVDYVIVRATDAPQFVSAGGADCGICGRDSLVEAALDLVQLEDLEFGKCRFVVAEPEGARESVEKSYARRGSIRVTTKYPRITQEYYNRIGVQADIVTLHGNIELGPIVGMSDRIVDITATGTTLRENNLVIVDDVMECSARFFASPASIRCDKRIRDLANALAAARKA
ncbi:MAG: ATP phosphoribosyltransferase [Phoenicibacter congonensis]|uniref:Multifunctional fusion protein n=1 Tax=Phoenicibacter congonensis TaxID=1944646 RepID=A0AA43UB87_9ACTN|nr:ATP phosphoribosyltransferase [Phoenicibacter congonensis]